MNLPPMPARFEELAAYNAVVHRTELVPAPEYAPDAVRVRPVPDPPVDMFTPEYHARMKVLQVEYKVWLYEQACVDNYVLTLPEGGLVLFPKAWPKVSRWARLKDWLGF